VYEQCKLFESKFFKIPSDKLPFTAQLVNGALAGATSAAVTCPMDVVKTRLQVQNTMEAERYKNTFDAFSRILREEGPRAFTKGIGTRVLWITPGTAITIAAYEEIKKLFH